MQNECTITSSNQTSSDELSPTYTSREDKMFMNQEGKENEKDNISLQKNLNNEKIDYTYKLMHDEDLQELLLYYMKLTFQLRNKNNDGASRTSEDYFASTDYDSEEEPIPRKTVRIVPSSTYKCKHCGKILQGNHSLKNHCMRKHGNPDDKNVLCDKCPTRFYTDFEFNRHYQTHNSVKNYLCHLCSKTYLQKSTLDLHLRYHKNDRRYQCEVCRKKFFTNNHLKRHFVIHTNKRDFKCEPCNRSFRHKDHLRRHLQIVHLGVRSHCCRECHKSFTYVSQLKLHEQSHTKPGFLLKYKHYIQNFKKKV